MHLKRIVVSFWLAMVLVMAVFFSAWSFGGRLVFPLVPGEYMGILVNRMLRGGGGIGFYQVLFLVFNVLFWAAVFFGLMSVIGGLRRGARNR
jgi:hypothetical protein